MTFIELKNAIHSLMKTIYPESEYKYYGVDTEEGYERPSFFCELRPIDITPMNQHTEHYVMAMYINYFQKKPDEVDMLQKAMDLKKLFGLGFYVDKRFVDVTDYDYTFVGNKRNILEISFTLEFQTNIPLPEVEDMMEELQLEIEMEE